MHPPKHAYLCANEQRVTIFIFTNLYLILHQQALRLSACSGGQGRGGVQQIAQLLLVYLDIRHPQETLVVAVVLFEVGKEMLKCPWHDTTRSRPRRSSAALTTHSERLACASLAVRKYGRIVAIETTEYQVPHKRIVYHLLEDGIQQ